MSLPCQDLSHFPRGRLIGQGNFGKVYETRGDNVLKVFHVEPLTEWNAHGVAPYQIREIDALRRCRGLQHIVQLREVLIGAEHETVVVLERFDGSLSSRCKMSLGDIKGVLRQILKGLQGLRSVGLVHLDIKPANILERAGGTDLCLCDFGTSRWTSAQVVGNATTLRYRSPEGLLGLQGVSACDVWSLGMVTLEWYTGRTDLIDASSELKLLSSLWQLVGFPSEETWPGFSRIPVCQLFAFSKKAQSSPSLLDNLLSEETDTNFAHLLKSMLSACPETRASLEKLAEHKFLRE